MQDLGGYPVRINPGDYEIKRLTSPDSSFTGFFFYEYRTQRYTAVFKGKPIFFSETPKQGILQLQEAERLWKLQQQQQVL